MTIFLYPFPVENILFIRLISINFKHPWFLPKKSNCKFIYCNYLKLIRYYFDDTMTISCEIKLRIFIDRLKVIWYFRKISLNILDSRTKKIILLSLKS